MKKKTPTIIIPYKAIHHYTFKMVTFSFFLLAIAVLFFYQTQHFLSMKKMIAVDSLPAIQNSQYELGELQTRIENVENVVEKRIQQ